MGQVLPVQPTLPAPWSRKLVSRTAHFFCLSQSVMLLWWLKQTNTWPYIKKRATWTGQGLGAPADVFNMGWEWLGHYYWGCNLSSMCMIPELEIFPPGRSVYEFSNIDVCVLVAQPFPTLCITKDCSLPGFSGYGILQARMLEWIAIFFSRGSFQPRDRTWVSCIAGRFLTIWAIREAPVTYIYG